MTTNALWLITLGIGLVVAIVAVILLQTLLIAVRRIDEGVANVWTMARQVAANTATTWMLGQTPRVVADIKEEALRHDALLSRDGGP